MEKIDEIDVKIIKALIKNARSKLTDIAQECNISITAVKNRIDHLEKNKIILTTALDIDMPHFGYKYTVLIGVNVDQAKEQEIIKIVKDYTQVAGIDQTIGNYDLCMFVFAKNVKQLDELKQIIRKQKGVKNIELNIWNKMHYNFANVKIESTK